MVFKSLIWNYVCLFPFCRKWNILISHSLLLKFTLQESFFNCFFYFGREESYLWFRWFQAILLYCYLTYPSAVSTCVCHGTQCQKLHEISRGMLRKVHSLKWFMTNITSLEIDRTFFELIILNLSILIHIMGVSFILSALLLK